MKHHIKTGILYFKLIICLSTLFDIVSSTRHEIPTRDVVVEELNERIHETRIDLWLRGQYYDGYQSMGDSSPITSIDKETLFHEVQRLEEELYWNSLKLGPIREVRRGMIQQSDCIEMNCFGDINLGMNKVFQIRGGGGSSSGSVDEDLTSYDDRLKMTLQRLSNKYGDEFTQAIKLNEEEHTSDCEASCELFYCAPKLGSSDLSDTWSGGLKNGTTFTSYHFGPIPPEDFSEEFGFPLDLIKVTDGKPLFSAEEAANVIRIAEEEGLSNNEYKSGKYKLGGDWLVNLPNTRTWFNEILETIMFPLIATIFPEIVSSSSALRAHSVSLLKYNVTHPRTDVHVDNGILAMTLAMTPNIEYAGGGTFFEHMGDDVILMDVGHGTFRPGSVRHGGHKVTKGTRYILGAFLLIEDKVEHVRRLKNRGSELRRNSDLEGAFKYFEWALAINPTCTTCLKDMTEILLTQKKYDEAEKKIRKVLELLEEKDSDALFSLGVILSEAGKDQESIEAYTKSVKLNADDAELCYNLGIKLGARGDLKAEMAMYAKATTVDPTFGGAWLNWGTSLAESGNLDDAEVMFLKGMSCPDVKHKAMMNLGLVYIKKAELSAAGGDLGAAKDFATKAGNLVDSAKPLLDASLIGNVDDDEAKKYSKQFIPLRVQCHRILGSILAGMKEFGESEIEMRKATESFPQIPGVWAMLERILEVQGKSVEAGEIRKHRESLI